MRIFLGCWVGFFLAVPIFAQSPPNRKSDEAAIRGIVHKYEDARNQPDRQKIEVLFTKDADQLVSTGEWRKGRSEVVRGTVASSQSASGKRTITIESVRFLAPSVALADARYEIAGTAGGASRKMWTTLILTRAPAGWHIAAIRNMLPAPPAPSK